MPTVFSAKSAKAFTAALVAGLSALAVVATDDGSASLATLTLAQWLTLSSVPSPGPRPAAPAGA